MLELSNSGLDAGAAELGARLTPDEMSLFTSIIQEPVSLPNAARALDDYITKIYSFSHPQDSEDLRARADELKKTKGYGG